MVDFALHHMPLWLAACLLVLLCMTGMELGRYVRGRLASRITELPEIERSEVTFHIITAVFGLLAFMVGLTFSIAVERFDDRQALVAEEATAIEVAFQRADLLAEPGRTDLQSALREYAKSRISPQGVWTEANVGPLERSHRMREKVWANARRAYGQNQTELRISIIEAVNEITAIGTRREHAGMTHIPSRIMNALLLYLLVASGVLGFLAGGGSRRHHAATALLFVMFAIAFVIILDLDRPRSGAIKVTQQPLELFIARLDRN